MACCKRYELGVESDASLEPVWIRRVLTVGSALVALVAATTAVVTFLDDGTDPGSASRRAVGVPAAAADRR